MYKICQLHFRWSAGTRQTTGSSLAPRRHRRHGTYDSMFALMAQTHVTDKKRQLLNTALIPSIRCLRRATPS